MNSYNFSKTNAFFLKKKNLFVIQRANKRKKNLILSLNFDKVSFYKTLYKLIYPLMTLKNPVANFLTFLFMLSLVACSSDEIALTVGDDVMNDDHNAYYTDKILPVTSTRLAKYVKTNNTGVALCGSYKDEYIGEITTNTVFKISPNVEGDNDIFNPTATFDSLVLVLKPNGYVYGDSLQSMNLSLHEVTANYQKDTFLHRVGDAVTILYQLNNSSTVPYDSVNSLVDFSFIPGLLGDDNVEVILPNTLGQEWFDSIVSRDPNYVINDENLYDSRFPELIFNGLTIRNQSLNNAVMGFNMPAQIDDDLAGMSVVTMHYHTTSEGKHVSKTHDFKIYSPSLQYNQVYADFSTSKNGMLKDIEPGGDAIPSEDTENLTFIQNGLGLSTKVDMPSLFDIFLVGRNFTIIDMDIELSTLPHSERNNFEIPSRLGIDRLQSDNEINPSGLKDASGNSVLMYSVSSNHLQRTVGAPITSYGWTQQDLWGEEDANNNSLLIHTGNGGNGYPNVNRMVIGNANQHDSKMVVKMYYTYFD